MTSPLCSRCKSRRAVYYHRLSGNKLCKHCFIRFVNRYLFREFGSRIKMLRREKISNAKFIFVASCNYLMASLAYLQVLEDLNKFLSKMPWLNYELEIVVDKCFNKVLHASNLPAIKEATIVDDVDEFIGNHVTRVLIAKRDHTEFLVVPYSLDILSYMVINAFVSGATKSLRVLCLIHMLENVIKPFMNLVLEDIAYYVYLSYGLDLLQEVSQHLVKVPKKASRYPITFDDLKPIFNLSGEYLFAPLKILSNFCKVVETC